MDNLDKNTQDFVNPADAPDPDQHSVQNGMTEELLIENFKDYILQKEGGADSVHHFVKYLNIPEASFYNHFSSLNAVRKQVWKEYFDKTKAKLTSDEIYLNYTVREKLLAFFYTLFELLKEDRSFIIKTSKMGLLSSLSNEHLESFKTEYFNYINDLIEEGKENGEVAERFLVSKQYSSLMQMHLKMQISWLK